MADSIRSILLLLFFADMAIMLFVGGRLLLTAARTRRAPEAAIGIVQLVLFAAAVCLWLAFYPPAFYRRGIVARAAVSAS